jgi:uncharacterized protein (TIGR03067 family)
MSKNLPARPNLDHLRKQAKELLAGLEAKDPGSVKTILEHLPSAKGMTPAKAMAMNLRLADAQSAIARKSGFASWPHLARHVEQLRALEGEWSFSHLEIDGMAVPIRALGTARLLIDGDRLRTEAPEGNYEGTFNIDVEADPHKIVVDFVSGPEAGNRNFGIFRLNEDQLEMCVNLNGKSHPTAFGSRAGSGLAYEILRRASRSQPEGVDGGTPPPARKSAVDPITAGFAFTESATLTRLQGEWLPVQLVRDGQAMPKQMLGMGSRNAIGNEVKVIWGGHVAIHALIRIDEQSDPKNVEYYDLTDACRGAIRLGIMQWIGEEACFCFAEPDQPRPTDFTCEPGSGRILSQWRRKKGHLA